MLEGTEEMGAGGIGLTGTIGGGMAAAGEDGGIGQVVLARFYDIDDTLPTRPFITRTPIYLPLNGPWERLDMAIFRKGWRFFHPIKD